MTQHHDHSVENAERAKQKLPLLYCPFGCNGKQVAPNSNGNAECCHLVGHTIDDKERIFEPLSSAPWNDEFFATTRRGRQKVQPTDIVINPLKKQKLRTGDHFAKSWVSARVYRQCTPEQAEAWRNKYARPEDYELNRELAEEDKDLLIKELQEKLAAAQAPATPIEDAGEAVNGVAFGPPEPGDLEDEMTEREMDALISK